MCKEYCVYIIYAPSIDIFYIGETMDLSKRLEDHNAGVYNHSFTKRADDWELFLNILCSNREQALRIEKHIKKMKSRIYLKNLTLYPEMIEKLKTKYQ